MLEPLECEEVNEVDEIKEVKDQDSPLGDYPSGAIRQSENQDLHVPDILCFLYLLYFLNLLAESSHDGAAGCFSLAICGVTAACR